MRQRIVITLPGDPGSTSGAGPVSIVCPSARAVRLYATGAGPDVARCGSDWYWNARRPGWLVQQFVRQVRAGLDPDAVRRHIHAMSYGGLSEHEAVKLIAARDCTHRGTGIEIWDADDVPTDRAYREAWRRQRDGGPIWIDLDAARAIQARRVAEAIDDWNLRERRDPRRWGHNGPALIELDWRWLGRATAAAQSIDDLKAVWPAELPRAFDTVRTAA